MAHPTATGKVIRLYANPNGTFIRLDIAPKTAPPDGYFRLRLSHPNYNALYSLALAAAANRWPLRIRIEGEEAINLKDPVKNPAVVQNLVVDWEGGQDDAD